MYTNADSLFNKMGELVTLVTEKKYDIIAITEVFPKNYNLDYNDNAWYIPGYTLHTPANKVFTGRGVIIYTKNSLSAYIIDNPALEYIEYIQIGMNINVVKTGSDWFSHIFTFLTQVYW